jgi:tetratricopeptide (TPR) repeat protein
MTMTALAKVDDFDSFADLATIGSKPTRDLSLVPPGLQGMADTGTREVQHARQVLERFPSSSTARCRLAQALFAGGEPTEAVEVAQTVVDHSAGRADRPSVLAAAYVLLAAGRADLVNDAVRGFDDTAARVVRARAAVTLNELDVALQCLEGTASYDAAITRGSILMALSRHAEAVHAYRQAIEFGHVTSDIMLNLAQAHEATGSTANALRAATVATGLSPLRIDAAVVLAFMRFENGDKDGAFAELQRVQAIRPTSIRPPLFLATLRFVMGDYAPALQEMRLLRRSTDPRFWKATQPERDLLETIMVLSRMRVGDLTAAHGRNRLLQLWVQSDYVNEVAGQAALAGYVLRSDAKALRSVVEKFAAVVPPRRAHWAQYQLALIEERFDDALLEAKEWLRVNPTSFPAAAAVMSIECDIRHDPAAAVQVGKKFRCRAPKSVDMVNTLAYYLILAGDLEEAGRLLALPVPQAPNITATRGLWAIYSGRVEEGRALYQQAAAMAAQSPGGVPLSDLILIRMAFALRAIGAAPVTPPNTKAWRDNVQFLMMEKYHGFSL